MRTQKSKIAFSKFFFLFLLGITLLGISTGCVKSSLPDPNGANSSNANNSGMSSTGATLISQVDYLSSATDKDTSTTLYTYDSNNRLLSREYISSDWLSPLAISKTYTYSDDTLLYSYSANGNRSGYLSGSSSISKNFIGLTGNLQTTIKTYQKGMAQYHYSNAALISLGTRLNTKSITTAFGLLPSINLASNYDSIEYNYNSSGKLSTVNFFSNGKVVGTNTYTLTFNGNNLTQSILSIQSPAGNLTTTTVYEYDNKKANNGLNIINGIDFTTDNNIVKITSNTTGVYTDQIIHSYSFQYDSQNRPIRSVGTLMETYNGVSKPVITINSIYTYKN